VKATSKRVTLRQSQLITTFGPGAMVDLPTRSVIIGGLDLWHMREKGSWQTIQEPRAVAILERLLAENGRLKEGVHLSLRSPPVDWGRNDHREPPGIEAKIFPAWFVTRDSVDVGGGARRRRLVRWRDLNPKGGRADYTGDDGKKTAITPIRFVAACKKGHIQDIDWTHAVHGAGKTCTEALSLEERGTSGDPRSTRIVCGCGASLSLHDAQAPGRFGRCRGARPWLDEREPEGCDEQLRFLTRTATNAYFPQVLTVISLPAAEDELTRLVEAHLATLVQADSAAGVAMARKYNDGVRAALEGYSDEEVFARVQQLQTVQQQSLAKTPKVAEFDLLASGLPTIGANTPDSKLFAETLSRDAWGGHGSLLAPIASVVAVHRLREVATLYGFTRFEAAPTAIDGELEELYIAVEGAALASELEWLPAIEQLGEGIFVRFDDAAIAAWLDLNGVREREQELAAGHDGWRAQHAHADRLRFPGGPYYMIHSLSHALMNEIALECGYPSTALKERIYPLYDEAGRGRFGLLIYTATAGAQGTLGGLLAVLPRLSAIINAALDKLGLCSSDPICAEHRPASHTDERGLAGAACHSCLLVAETSCEQRNLYLDRALVVPTISTEGSALFVS
jgi:hypothetical protein